MTIKDMVVGLRYIVTQSSSDETFLTGDHIILLENGDLMCREAAGWIDAEDVENATEGMIVELDKEYEKAKWMKAKRYLEYIEKSNEP